MDQCPFQSFLSLDYRLQNTTMMLDVSCFNCEFESSSILVHSQSCRFVLNRVLLSLAGARSVLEMRWNNVSHSMSCQVRIPQCHSSSLCLLPVSPLRQIRAAESNVSRRLETKQSRCFRITPLLNHDSQRVSNTRRACIYTKSCILRSLLYQPAQQQLTSLSPPSTQSGHTTAGYVRNVPLPTHHLHLPAPRKHQPSHLLPLRPAGPTVRLPRFHPPSDSARTVPPL
jgi:hypothetical protein